MEITSGHFMHATVLVVSRVMMQYAAYNSDTVSPSLCAVHLFVDGNLSERANGLLLDGSTVHGGLHHKIFFFMQLIIKIIFVLSSYINLILILKFQREKIVYKHANCIKSALRLLRDFVSVVLQ